MFDEQKHRNELSQALSHTSVFEDLSLDGRPKLLESIIDALVVFRRAENEQQRQVSDYKENWKPAIESWAVILTGKNLSERLANEAKTLFTTLSEAVDNPLFNGAVMESALMGDTEAGKFSHHLAHDIFDDLLALQRIAGRMRMPEPNRGRPPNGEHVEVLKARLMELLRITSENQTTNAADVRDILTLVGVSVSRKSLLNRFPKKID